MRRARALTLCAFVAGWAPQASGEPVRVGSKGFTESVVLGEVAVALARARDREAVHRRELGGTRILWGALLRGEIDAYPEYTGTLAREILHGEGLTTDDEIRQALAARGIVMGRPLGFNNTYALGLRRSRAEELGLRRISDLRAHPDLVLGFSNEFLDRGDGWPALRQRHALPHERVTGLAHDLAYRGLQAGDIDVIDLYSTDAEIVQRDLAVLVDDLGHFPRYDAVLLWRADLELRALDVVAAWRLLEGSLDEARMIELNAAVEVARRSEADVAAAFVSELVGREVHPVVSTRWSRLARRTGEHVALVLVSLTAAVVLAVPLGIWAARRRRAGSLVLAVVGVLQTIPSLALLVVLLPLLGIGARPAIAALFLYSLLPIVGNVHAGLLAIPADLADAARALGLPPGARLWRIELPLALPSILAGIKTAAVINIGTATLGALVGAGGYGQPILTGIRLEDVGLILEGAVPAALLAIAARGALDLAERWLVSPGLRVEEPA